MRNNFIGVSRPYQVTATVSQSLAASTNVDYTISINRFASAALATIHNSTLMGSPYTGYAGVVTILRPASATGRSSSLQVSQYPTTFESSLIAQLSEGLFGGCRLNDCWIDNAASNLVFQFRNPTAGSLTLQARITALVFP